MHAHTYHYAALLRYTHLPAVSLCVDNKHSRIVCAQTLTAYTHTSMSMYLMSVKLHSLELWFGAYHILDNTRYWTISSYAIVLCLTKSQSYLRRYIEIL
jgi:hypothetical protein